MRQYFYLALDSKQMHRDLLSNYDENVFNTEASEINGVNSAQKA